MREILIGISALLAVISGIFYVIDILKGRAKPHRITRFVLVFISALSTFSLFAANNQVAVWLAGIYMIRSFLFFILSIKYGMGGWSKLDILCLLIALAGILLWRITNDPLVAFYASLFADFTGFFPTLLKTYKQPHTEVVRFFSIEMFAAFFTLMAIQHWTPQEYLFPLYILLLNAAMVALLLRGRFTS